MGRLLVGQSLQITATKADGTTLTFKVNGEGVFISNGSLVIEPLNTEDESNGVEIHPGKGKGLIITHKDNKFRVVLNADRGLVFQRQEIGSGDWTKVNEPVFIDTEGNAVFGGDIHARRLYLQEIGGENILTYIDQKYDPIKKKYTYTNSFDDNTNIDNKGETEEVPQYKISGNYLEGRGLKAYDKNNNLRVHINGADGSLKMYNGYIEMQNSNGNELYIDPENFIKWIINGEDKFYYDTDADALVFGGTIKTSEDAEIGNNLYLGTNGANEVKKIQFQSGSLIRTCYDHTGTRVPTGMEISASSLKLPEETYLGQQLIATKNQIDSLQRQIDELKTSSPPILP